MDFKPAECTIIEDSEIGLKAAVTTGFDVFGFKYGKNRTAINEPRATVFS